jgi:hypothetical protein
MKKCPYCAEEIQDAAIFCKWCKRDIPHTHISPSTSNESSPVLTKKTSEHKVSPPLSSKGSPTQPRDNGVVDDSESAVEDYINPYLGHNELLFEFAKVFTGIELFKWFFFLGALAGILRALY